MCIHISIKWFETVYTFTYITSSVVSKSLIVAIAEQIVRKNILAVSISKEL